MPRCTGSSPGTQNGFKQLLGNRYASTTHRHWQDALAVMTTGDIKYPLFCFREARAAPAADPLLLPALPAAVPEAEQGEPLFRCDAKKMDGHVCGEI